MSRGYSHAQDWSQHTYNLEALYSQNGGEIGFDALNSSNSYTTPSMVSLHTQDYSIPQYAPTTSYLLTNAQYYNTPMPGNHTTFSPQAPVNMQASDAMISQMDNTSPYNTSFTRHGACNGGYASQSTGASLSPVPLQQSGESLSPPITSIEKSGTSDSSFNAQDSPFYCAFCSRWFDRKGIYNRHIKRHKKPFKCDWCKWGFSEKKDLRRHEGAAHRHMVEERSPDRRFDDYYCPLRSCKKNKEPFNRQYNLDRHLKRNPSHLRSR